jgi:polar amino acid transport system substrate-binding protein
MSTIQPFLRAMLAFAACCAPLIPAHAIPSGGSAIVAAAPAAADQLSQILSRKVLRVAVPKEFPPFGFIQHGEPSGYDISVARIMAMDLGVRLELVPVASGDRLPYLQEGKVDLVIASLGKTPEREQKIDFSTPYAPLYLGVFGRSNAASSELSGRKVAVTKGSLESAELRRLSPQSLPVEYENSKDILRAYVGKEVDHIAVGSAVVESIPDVPARDNTKLMLLLKDSPCYIGVRKGEQRLLARVNKVLDEAGGSGVMTINALIWFKTTLPPGFFKK